MRSRDIPHTHGRRAGRGAGAWAGARAGGLQAGRAGLVTVLSVLLLAGAGGYAAYDAGWLDRFVDPTQDVAPAAVPPPEGVRLPPAPAARPVLAAAGAVATRNAPSPRALRRHVADTTHDDDLGRHLGVLVETLGGGRDELLRMGGHDRFTPASSMKLLTTTAALATLGPGHRFRTTVVQGRGKRGRRSVVLVGGGDPLLSRVPADDDTYPQQATLRDLARQTARSLRADGVRRVRLGYDASLFRGPAVNPHWEPGYVPDDVVSPVSALWVDEGRDTAGLAARSSDPAAAAAASFAQFLERAGVKVQGAPTDTAAPEGAREMAAVRSAPLAQIVQHVIELSDNEGAEVLQRQVALGRGRPGSSVAGSQAVLATLDGLGVDVRGARVHDGSGLARDNRLRLDTLVDTLQVAASPDRPDLRRVVSGLPVAGFTGSLAYRYTTEGEEGRGLVRAKTGTLSRVHALVGVTVDTDGTPLVFATVADRVRLIDTLDARAALDAITADLATCC